MNEIARETLEVLDRGFYETASGTHDIAAAQRAAVEGTRLFRPPALAELAVRSGPDHEHDSRTSLAVTDERTQDAARRLVQDEGVPDLVVLNFASARNVGGGFLNGARAQEEDIARSCGLFRCLETQPDYYDTNRRTKSFLYTDHIIYSPGVPWFRDGARAFLPAPFQASVITAPAPNAGEFLRRGDGDPDELVAALVRRAGYVLAVAEACGHSTLLLGAWGCGVFRNRPEDVAEAFLSHLEQDRFQRSFRRIEFAVYDSARGQPNLAAFRERAGGGRAM